MSAFDPFLPLDFLGKSVSMNATYPAGWASLKHPWTRQELMEVLRELASDDPCGIWEEERRTGHLSGFSFFIVEWLFDDAVIDEHGIGFCLFDMDEVRAIDAVKGPIDKISDKMPNASNEEVVAHPLWPEVKRLAQAAIDKLGAHDR